MDSVSVNKFRDNLKSYIERVVSEHSVLKVTRRSGEDFVVMSAEDWEREQETLYVLQNQNLMRQLTDSMQTHEQDRGFRPAPDDLRDITGD